MNSVAVATLVVNWLIAASTSYSAEPTEKAKPKIVVVRLVDCIDGLKLKKDGIPWFLTLHPTGGVNDLDGAPLGTKSNLSNLINDKNGKPGRWNIVISVRDPEKTTLQVIDQTIHRFTDKYNGQSELHFFIRY